MQNRSLDYARALRSVVEETQPERLRLQVFRFASSVAPGATLELSEPLPADCTVEGLRIRIYAGAMLDLRVSAWLVPAEGPWYPLIRLIGKQFVDGEGDTWTFRLREPAYSWRGDSLRVRAQHVNPAGVVLNFAVDVECDFAGGPFPVTRLVEPI